MELRVENLSQAIREAKGQLRRKLPSYPTAFREVESEMRRRVAQIVKER